MRPLLLERDQVGAEASSGAAGLLTAQAHTQEPGPLLDLKLAARALYAELAEELRQRTEIDIEYRRLGHLVPVLNEQEGATVKARVAWQAARGLAAVWLEAREARELEPGLAGGVQGAGWFPEDHHVNNTAVTQALASAALRLGGEIRTGCAATGLLREGDRVTGVRTGEETMAAREVVLSAGAWSQGFEESAGVPLPLMPAKGQIVVGRLPAPALQHVVYGAGGYAIPRASGEHILGSTVEFVGFDKRVTIQAVAGLLAGITAQVPAMREAELAASWGCLRPAAPDGLPLIGRVPARPGLVVATGHYRNGILLGPLTGQLVAELILDGAPSIPLDLFRPDRSFPPGPPPAD